MALKSKLVHKKFIDVALKNNHLEFLKLLDLLDPIKLSDRSNHDLPLKLFIIKTIIGQQVSVKAADAVWNKVKPVVAGDSLNLADLENVGLSKMKKIYVEETFNYFSKNQYSRSFLRNCSEKELEDIFLKIKGIGPWTLNVIRMFYIYDEDIWLPEDLVIKKSLMYFFDLEKNKDVFKLYGPYKTYFCMYLWAGSKLFK
ncbi:DNA-3-methyladenine glycosylase 2 family protein [Gammaproteobacteria bacterium]|jgi:DNA-3-methyladenine glycosylase II|nr:DNA-3-methyladenine glycosylase 2 family protein [Gammaproteobacteria bacterium]